MQYVFPELDNQVGYTPIGMETGEFANVADNKHFYQVGNKPELNPIIDEVPGFYAITQDLFEEYNSLYSELMSIVAISLRLDENHFSKYLGNSVMRNIHYPAMDNPTINDEEVTRGGNILGMCASKHTDINWLTLLHATEPGLELWFEDQWNAIQCNADTLIINVGDMLWHLTAGYYKSGIHRVVCKSGKERTSSPFFGHQIAEASIIPLFQFKNYDSKDFPYKTEGEFLHKRLVDIGAIKE